LGLVYDATEIDFDNEALYASDPLVGPAEMNLSTFSGNGGKLTSSTETAIHGCHVAGLLHSARHSLRPLARHLRPTDQLVRVGSPQCVAWLQIRHPEVDFLLEVEMPDRSIRGRRRHRQGSLETNKEKWLVIHA
jgi:hypothetical protein